jgi:DHA3 family macrolide efflux protein-like MFS transporter
MKEYKSLFTNKNFIALWLSQFLSQVSIQALTYLVILKIFDSTGSTIATSLVWVIFVLPAITLGPFAATYVDLVDRKNTLLITNIAQAITIFLYSFIEHRFLYLSYAVVLIYSIFNQFYIPAEVSSLPYLVDNKNLSRANGLFLGSYQIGLVLGFGIAGVLIEFMSFRSAFLIASFLMLIAFFSVIILPKMESEDEDDLHNLSLSQIIFKVFEGMDFIRRRHAALLPFLTIIGLQVALPIVVVNLPIINQNILGINPHLSGITITAPAGLGALLGIIFTTKRIDRKGMRSTVKESLIAMVISFWGLILLVPIIAMPYRLIVSTFLFILVGASFIGIFITAQTRLQFETPKKLLGRVFGNSWFFTSAGTIIPMLFSEDE